MNTTELRMAMRTLPFLDSNMDRPERALELRGAPTPKLLVWDPSVIEWLFRSDARLAHPGSRSLAPLFGDASLLWVDGSRHTAYRKTLGPRLRGRRLGDYRELIAETTHAAIDELRPGDTIRLPDWTRQLALRIVGRITLGEPDDATLAAFTGWIDRALGSRGRTLAYRFLRGGLPRSGVELDQALLRRAKESAPTEPPSLAALMLAEDGPLGGVDDPELRDQLASLLFAGHETTASATAWTLYWLDRCPEIRADVLDEVRASSDDGIDPSGFPLLQAVIQEALRLAPPVTVAENRALPEEAELLGRRMPAGTVFTTSIYLAHRQRDVFPNPTRFDPCRFLDQRPPSHCYLPFGGGSRLCLGSQLAQVEIRMITIAILRRCQWHCVNPHRGVPRLRGHAMAPDARLRMRVAACQP